MKTDLNTRYCHCGRLTSYANSDLDERYIALKGDPFWLIMVKEFCGVCLGVRCDAYPGACWDLDEEATDD